MQARMTELLPLAMGVVTEFWDEYEPGEMEQWGITMEEFAGYAGNQFDKRLRVLERDRGKALAEIEASTTADIETEEAEAAAVG
jgi:hypothetical protein